jgi:hypothetical protein
MFLDVALDEIWSTVEGKNGFKNLMNRLHPDFLEVHEIEGVLYVVSDVIAKRTWGSLY